jgi:hypothetical protein
MNQAPAVSFPTTRSYRHLLCIVALTISAGLTASFLGHKQSLSSWELLAVTCTLLVAAAHAFRDWLQSPVGRLHWDGQCWRWSEFGEQSACDLVVRIDWQSGLLVSVKSPGQTTTWLWLDASSDGANWNRLRRAVFSRHSISANDDQIEPKHGDIA